MREVFVEETSKNANLKSETAKYDIISVVSVLSFVFVALWILIFFFAIPMQALGENTAVLLITVLVPSALFIVVGIYLHFFRYRYCNDFDYTFVSGSLRIARVIKNFKRKKVAEFEFNSIQKIGYYDSEEYNKIISDKEVNVIKCTPNKTATEGRKLYYIYAVIGAEREVFIVDSSTNFMANVISFTGRIVLEKDFK